MTLWHHGAAHLILVLGLISPRAAIFGAVSGLEKNYRLYDVHEQASFHTREISISFCQILFFCSLVTTLQHVKFNYTGSAQEKFFI